MATATPELEPMALPPALPAAGDTSGDATTDDTGSALPHPPGLPRDLKRALRHVAPYDFPLLAAVVMLLGLGAVMVYSATINEMTQIQGDGALKLKTHLVHMSLGIIVMLAATFTPYGRASRSRPDLHGRPGVNPLATEPGRYLELPPPAARAVWGVAEMLGLPRRRLDEEWFELFGMRIRSGGLGLRYGRRISFLLAGGLSEIDFSHSSCQSSRHSFFARARSSLSLASSP